MNNFPLLKENSTNEVSNSLESPFLQSPITTKPKNKIRQKSKDAGLKRLTMKFLKYIKKTGLSVINLKDVEENLNVRRRRIYDITNVIEGLGYIKKVSRSKIIWTKKDLLSTLSNEEISENLENQLKALEKEASVLKHWNNELRINLKNTMESDIYKMFGYFTENDIKNITDNEDLNLVAIRAPNGTTIDIPDPQNVEKLYEESFKNMINGQEKFDKELLLTLKQKYQIFLNSVEGDIKVFLILASNLDKHIVE